MLGMLLMFLEELEAGTEGISVDFDRSIVSEMVFRLMLYALKSILVGRFNQFERIW